METGAENEERRRCRGGHGWVRLHGLGSSHSSLNPRPTPRKRDCFSTGRVSVIDQEKALDRNRRASD